MEKNNIKEKIAEKVRIPKDVYLGVPILTMTGHYEIIIENYRGIMEYTEKVIRIQTKIGKICILGKSLEIAYYTNDEMKIVGDIFQIEFQKEDKFC